MLRRFLAVMAAAAAIFGASTGAALAEYPPNSSSGEVSSTTIVVGSYVDFSGGGFAFGSPVTVSVDSALYATVTASGPATALGRSSSTHFATAAFVQPAAAQTAASFSIRITMQKVGYFTLTGAGVDPAGNTRTVTSHVTVVAKATTQPTSSGSTLPFTGSSALIPGLLIGVTMLAG